MANSVGVSPCESFTSEFNDEFPDSLPVANHVYSDRVQTLAPQIYNELQQIMSRFPCSESREAFAGLMPLIANVLESLDVYIIDNQRFRVELELCKTDSEQLVSALEKEKSCKKKVEQRLIELEFQAEEEKHHLNQKIESLESLVKSLEQKAKHSSDHYSQMEEKDEEMKNEYNQLSAKYSELLESHCDLVRRVKIILGYEEDDFCGKSNSSGPNSFLEFSAQRDEIDHITDQSEQENQQTTVGVYRFSSSNCPQITWSDHSFSPKSARLIPRDLMDKVDVLESQLGTSRDEKHQLMTANDCLKEKNSQLEEENEKLREAIEEFRRQKENDVDEKVPLGQAEPMTSVELANVTMERDEYKQKLIQLQETVRWRELINSSESESAKEKSAIWI